MAIFIIYLKGFHVRFFSRIFHIFCNQIHMTLILSPVYKKGLFPSREVYLRTSNMKSWRAAKQESKFGHPTWQESLGYTNISLTFWAKMPVLYHFSLSKSIKKHMPMFWLGYTG